MNQQPIKYLLLFFMLFATFLGVALKPVHKINKNKIPINLEKIIPKEFGGWKEDVEEVSQLVNPEQKEMLDKIYTNVLSRNYKNSSGDRIMLSIAYGADQSDSVKLHYPDICYPAQGFMIESKKIIELQTKYGKLRVKRLMTSLGPRYEPLTYWAKVGDHIVLSGTEAKITQIKYAMNGDIPDGLIFRVSNLDSNPDKGYLIQSKFIDDLLSALPPKDRQELTGL